MDEGALALEALIRNISVASVGLLCSMILVISTWLRAKHRKGHAGHGGDGWVGPILVCSVGLIICLSYSVGQGAEDIARVITYYSQDNQPEVRRAVTASDFPGNEDLGPITAEQAYADAIEEPDY